MGREVRRVPADWKHPVEGKNYVPLFDGCNFTERCAKWDEESAQWDTGFRRNYEDPSKWVALDSNYLTTSFSEWSGERPCSEDYMPEWPDELRTHYQMYETTSEGTPVSPVFATPEELAHWLADNEASAFGSMTASYEDWLRVARGGYAPSAVIVNGVMSSGVAADL